jgi:hypothetical protein
MNALNSNKNVIYQVITPLVKNSLYDDRKFCLKTLVPSVKKYASVVGAKYKVIGRKVKTENKGQTDKFFAFKFKTKLLKKFSQSEYDNFLFLDEDVEVVNFIENMFNLNEQIYLKPWPARQKERLRKRNAKIYNYLGEFMYNYGVCYIKKDCAMKLSKIDVNKILKFGFTFPCGYHISATNLGLLAGIDEIVLAIQLYITDTKVTQLVGNDLERWHWGGRQVNNPKTKYNFIHFQGKNKSTNHKRWF